MTEVTYVSAPPVQLIHFVDENNSVFSTSTVTRESSSSPTSTEATPTSEAAHESVAPPQEASTSSTITTPASETPSTTPSVTPESSASATSPSPEPSSSPAVKIGGSGNGITYTPYTDSGQCKLADEVSADFDKLGDFSQVRLYGTDCGHLENVVPTACNKGMKVLLGIAKEKATAEAVGAEIEAIAKGLGGSFACIDTIAVGNENVHNGGSAAVAIAAVNKAREVLRGMGFQGSVVVPETSGAILKNPELCQHQDYVAANIHAFFDGQIEASRAGEFVVKQAQSVSEACGGKQVIITETGWPNNGGTNDASVPSPENQQAAIASIKAACAEAGNMGYYVLSAFNEPWKKDLASTFGCEKFWGILG